MLSYDDQRMSHDVVEDDRLRFQLTKNVYWLKVREKENDRKS